jgi:hypothetical protein
LGPQFFLSLWPAQRLRLLWHATEVAAGVEAAARMRAAAAVAGMQAAAVGAAARMRAVAWEPAVWVAVVPA